MVEDPNLYTVDKLLLCNCLLDRLRPVTHPKVVSGQPRCRQHTP